MGPLKGYRIVEMAGLGPVPLCGMILADLGAEVIRIDRKALDYDRSERGGWGYEIFNRGRPSVALDLKTPEGVETLLKLIERADALIEGFRPGVMERLGLGPDLAMKRNPRLVYGRMTGWGQDGPLAKTAGHDINYISLTGALHAIGPTGGKPVPPLNLLGDFGGGTMFLAVGVLAALLEAKSSGKGQIIDSAMTEGTSILMTMAYGMRASGYWTEERGSNALDGGAHFYGTYETKDGKYISIGSIEPQFYALLREKAGLTDPAFDDQTNREHWPKLREKLTAVFKTKTRDEWCALMEGTDVCFAPILTMAEAFKHPHNAARKAFVEVDGVLQPAPAPRFSRTKPELGIPPQPRGANTEPALRQWGFTDADLSALKEAGAI